MSIITTTKMESEAADMITSMSTITMTMMESVVADMTTSMSIIMTMTESVAADMTTSMSIITMTMMESAAADMIITIITQMRYFPAGDVRLLRNLQERILRRCLRSFPLLMSMV